jgi:C4-dicarboxylate transporter DctQ subunit
MGHPTYAGVGRVVNSIEEVLIAFILGAMTLIQFANVVVRKWFGTEAMEPIVNFLGLPTNLLWALEATVFLFAWLVLLGASYAVKTRSHLGVDVIVDMVGPGLRKAMAVVSVVICVAFAFLLLKGSWDYWAPFVNLDPTSGRWFPTGFDSVREQGWYEVNDIPMPDWLQWMGAIFNDGDRYEKIPRLIPYAVMPLSMGLLLFRFLQVAGQVWRGEVDRMIVSHESEDAVEEAARTLKATEG